MSNMLDLWYELYCCADSSFDIVQLSAHGSPGRLGKDYLTKEQLEEIKRSRDGGIALPKDLKRIDDALKEARRVAPNLDIFACCFARGDEGKGAFQLLMDLYGFENITAPEGTCGDLLGGEFRSDYWFRTVYPSKWLKKPERYKDDKRKNQKSQHSDSNGRLAA